MLLSLVVALGALVACRETGGGKVTDAGPAPTPSAVAVATHPDAAAATLDSGVSSIADASARARAARPPAPGCRSPSGPSAYRGHLKRPEGERAFEVRLPAAPVDPMHPARVVFVIHPFGSSALDFMNATHFPEIFGAAGWVVISPEGVNKSFNAGDCCGEAAHSKIDDVGFLLAILDDVRERSCIDDDRVYLTGFSNGGFMSQAFACAHADRVGAIASVGAVLGVRPCEPSEPVSVLLVNGVGDDVIPMDGGGPFRTRPLTETLGVWRDAGHCEARFGDAGVMRSPVGATCRVEPCAEGRTLEACTVPYAHVWMVRSHPAGDPPSQRQTAREMLEFFDGYGVR